MLFTEFMHIYIVTNECFPNGMAATGRIKCYARALHEAGVPCEILLYHRTERYGVTPINTEGKGIYEGIPFRYIGGTPLRERSVVVRKVNDWLDKRSLIKFLDERLQPGDCIFSYDRNNNVLLRLVSVARKHGAFVACDLCELPYGTGPETRSAIRGRRIFLSKVFPLLDGVVAISDALADLAHKHVNKNCSVVKVPIMVDYAQYHLDDLSHEATTPYIFHSGTLFEQKDGIVGMIEAFGKATKRLSAPVQFISTGTLENSPHCDEIKRIIDQYGIQDKVRFTGYLGDEELKAYLQKASLVIINKYRTQQNQYCFSTKLGEYMAAGKTVIITKVGEAMNWLTNGKDAIVVEPENNDALADAIVMVMSDLSRYKTMGENAKITCQKAFDYRNHGARLRDFFENLGKGNVE